MTATGYETDHMLIRHRETTMHRACLQAHQRALPLKLRAVGQASLAGNRFVLAHYKCHLRLIEASPDGYKRRPVSKPRRYRCSLATRFYTIKD